MIFNIFHRHQQEYSFYYSVLSHIIFSLCLIFSLYSSQVISQNIDINIQKEEKVLTLYHDADWSNNIESAESIWRGVETALSEVNHRVQGYRIVFIKKDHSGNVVRSLRNMHDFLEDDTALAVISGIHSPPLIKHRRFINENKILTLVPWAAGGPITRYPSEENWVFRASIDDTQAAGVIVNYALTQKGCKVPHLLLENTPWGQSNLSHMTRALKQHGHTNVQVTRFDWNIKKYIAQSTLQHILAQSADCILLVSNAFEGTKISKAMASLPEKQRIPIVSHWGITAGHFPKELNSDMRDDIDLSFIQSCFSFMESPLSDKGTLVFNQAKTLFPDHINTPIDIRSPVGFIHGYDITLILLAALNKVTLSDDIYKNRNKLRLALEDLNKPILGLIKMYQQPFSRFSETNIDAHEALNASDYCMAKYGVNDEIILLTH